MNATVLKQDDYKTLIIAGIPFTARPIEPYFGYVGEFDEVSGDYGSTLSNYDVGEVVEGDNVTPDGIVITALSGGYNDKCEVQRKYVRAILPRGAKMSDVSYLTDWKLSPVIVLYKNNIVGVVMPVKR